MAEDSSLRQCWLGLLLLLAVGCFQAKSGPRSEVPPEIVKEQALERLRGQAVTPEDNSYRALEGVLGQPKTSQAEPFTVLSPIYKAYQSEGTSEALNGIYEANALGTLERFEACYVKLKEGLARPHFEWSQEQVLDTEAFLAVVESCLVLGLHHELADRVDEACDCYLTALELSARVSGKGTSAVQKVSLEGQRLAVNALMKRLQAGVSAKALGEAGQRLAKLPITESHLLDVGDHEFAISGDSSYMEVRPYLAALVQPPAENEYHQRILHFRFALTRLGAVRLVVAAQEYKNENGTFPPKLKALVPAYLEAVPEDYLNPDGVYLYQEDGDRFFLRTQSPELEKLDLKGPFFTHAPM